MLNECRSNQFRCRVLRLTNRQADRRERGRLNGIYVKHTGQPLEQVERDMERDRFMSGDDAKAYGLIDAVLDRRPGEAPVAA